MQPREHAASGTSPCSDGPECPAALRTRSRPLCSRTKRPVQPAAFRSFPHSSEKASCANATLLVCLLSSLYACAAAQRVVGMLGPRNRWQPVGNRIHTDALGHRAHDLAQVAAHAFVVDHGEAAATVGQVVEADRLMRGVLAGGVAARSEE